MKKLMVFAMTAMVALASCSKTELVDNSAPTPISFKAVNGNMTKAVQETGSITQDLGVVAYLNDVDNTLYFDKTQFATNTDGIFTSENPKYWPIDSELNFLVYSPYSSNPTISNQSLSVTVSGNTNYQYDYLYGKEYYTEFDKTSGDVPVELCHAMSLVEVKFNLDQKVTIYNASLNNTIQAGTYTVSYANNMASTPIWTNQGEASVNFAINGSSGKYLVVPTNDLVVPTNDQTSPTITFDYHLTGMEQGATIPHTIYLTETWVPGTKYVYEITITPVQISFEPSIGTWSDGDITTTPLSY